MASSLFLLKVKVKFISSITISDANNEKTNFFIFFSFKYDIKITVATVSKFKFKKHACQYPLE